MLLNKLRMVIDGPAVTLYLFALVIYLIILGYAAG